MDEKQLQNSLNDYRSQLDQIELALGACPEDLSEELFKLRDDLKQVVQLTEESLLTLKKSILLSALDGQNAVRSSSHHDATISHQSSTQDAMDAEFAAFQAAISEETNEANAHQDFTSSPAVTNRDSSIENRDTASKGYIPTEAADCIHSSEDSAESELSFIQKDQITDGEIPDHTLTEDDFSKFVGMRCKAPFSHSWGQHQYHNAMVVSVEATEMDSPPKVRVMFSNPTHRSLLPCPFFLESRCRYADDCRYCHGHLVDVEDLRNYEEPDFSALSLGSSCLAKDEDHLWYKATVVEVLPEHCYQVMFDSNQDTATVDVENILPAGNDSEDEDGSESSSDDKSAHGLDLEEEDEDELPVFLWKPPPAAVAVGEWESHTRGIASKLMAKMGFIAGQGLGKTGQGRAEPVPIQVLPQGKSLDKIMELKEVAGDRDLYDVLKKQRRKQKKLEQQAEKEYIAAPKGGATTVFNFLNKKLNGKKGNLKDLVRPGPQHSEQAKHIGERELKEKSDRQVNVQLLKTHEEIRKVNEEKLKISMSLERNEGRDRAVTKRMKDKLHSLDQYLDQLNRSEKSITMHRQRRSDHKKLTVF